jgi:F420-dependent oxidoreductase-like protein
MMGSMTAPLFGYHMPSFSFPGVPPERLFDHLAGLARAADQAGFDLITVMDHFYQIANVGPETEPMLEAYTTLGALAARTSRVRLSALVTGVTYRNPALLVKEVTTLDVVSGGRAIFGIGAAWNEDEHRGYGFEYPPIGRRLDRLEEALKIARLMFSEERPSFEGRYYRIERALNSPRPLQPGGPKILVGGGGEKRTLRLVARYADISHWFGSLEEGKRKLEILDRYCDEEGRDPAAITRTVSAPVTLRPGDDLEQHARVLRDFMAAGFHGFTFRNPNLNTPELLQAAGELKKLL